MDSGYYEQSRNAYKIFWLVYRPYRICIFTVMQHVTTLLLYLYTCINVNIYINICLEHISILLDIICQIFWQQIFCAYHPCYICNSTWLSCDDSQMLPAKKVSWVLTTTGCTIKTLVVVFMHFIDLRQNVLLFIYYEIFS